MLQRLGPPLLLLTVAVVGFLPFLGYPEWRGTEARRVEIAHSMVRSGDYIVPRLWNEVTYAKPPLYYWVLASLIAVGGPEPWLMRLPSLVGFWLLAVLAFFALRRWHGETTAWAGALGVLVAPLVLHDAPFAEIDPFFAVLTAASVLLLSDAVYEGRRGALVWAGILGGLAILTKGPPYLMFCAGPFMLWFRQSRLRGWWIYLPLVLGFYVVYKVVLDQSKPGEDAGAVAVSESLGRMAFWSKESLEGLPAHVVNSLLVVGLPFSFWLLPWFRRTRKGRDVATERSRFLLWGALGAFVILCFSRGRASRYLLPAVPLLICGLAPLVAQSLATHRPPARSVRRVLAVFGILMALGAMALPFVRHPYPGTTGFALLGLASIAFFVHSQRRLVQFCIGMPLVIAWAAFPDRIEYHRNAVDFAPDPAAILGRELQARGITELETYDSVNTSVLLHARDVAGDLEVYADFFAKTPPTRRWLLVTDRGYRKRGPTDVRVIPGYREVLRVQSDKNKSLSLRQKL